MTAAVSIGVAGTLGPTAIAEIAAAAEREGLHALWVNDTPGGDSLAALEAAASATRTLTLATGVVPLDRRSADEIAVAAAALPAERLVLGVGTGQAAGPVLAVTRASVRALRARTWARIVVGALGPRLRELAVTESDGVLLNWLPAEVAAAQTAAAHATAPASRVVLYVRTALDEHAVPRLRQESARYAAFPKYAANFARLQVAASDTVLVPQTAAAGLAAYRGAVDEVVLRAITATDDLPTCLRFVAAAGELVRVAGA